MPPPPESARSLFEWAWRWIVWSTEVGIVTALSVVISLIAAHGVLLGLAIIGIRIDGKTEVFYGLGLAWMVAPLPVLLFSHARAPAFRRIVTASLLAVGMFFIGFPVPGLGWKYLVLWLFAWTPSWVTLVFVFRKKL